MTSRRWCFTINNPVDDEPWHELPQGVVFICWQKERGEQGTEHLQGYVHFRRPVRASYVETFCGGRAHLEPAHGTEQQCIDYCSKEDTRIAGPWQYGTPTSQGQRSDLAEFSKAVLGGTKKRQLAEEYPATFLLHASAVDKLARLVKPPQREEMEVYLIWGTTGTGKTHSVYTLEPGVFSVPAPTKDGLLWFDGYDGEEAILLDDFEGGIPLKFLLRLLDKWPLAVPIKGGFVNAAWKRVWITSNQLWDTWYDWHTLGQENKNALQRRLTKIFALACIEDAEEIYAEFQ